MSLVGPRPHALAHDEYYSQLVENYNGRQAVKPGITGWAQINGARGETPEITDMRRRVEFDLWYIRHQSLGLDLKIIVLTAVKVLRSSDAF
jgi:putative colanic acid biosynthesis UDP-glucose lipid carrier transferase